MSSFEMGCTAKYGLAISEDGRPKNFSALPLWQVNDQLSSRRMVFDIFYSVAIFEDSDCIDEQYAGCGISKRRHDNVLLADLCFCCFRLLRPVFCPTFPGSLPHALPGSSTDLALLACRMLCWRCCLTLLFPMRCPSLALCSSNSGTSSGTHGSSRALGPRTSAIVPTEHSLNIGNLLCHLTDCVLKSPQSSFQNCSVHLEFRHRRNCNTDFECNPLIGKYSVWPTF
jgi:hypothetical protein